MKKFTKFLTILFLSIGAVFGLLACDNGENPEQKPEIETFSITIPDVEHGSVTASSTLVEKGQSVELIVSPDLNYELEYLKVNGYVLTVTNNKVTIDNVTENKTVSASFIGVKVNVSFVVDGSTLSTSELRYGSVYGELPTAQAIAGYAFNGWYTEANGAGSKVTKESLVNVGSDHSLYAYFEALPINVEVSGQVSKLVKLPSTAPETATLNVKVTENGNDVTNTSEIQIISSEPGVVMVDGLTLIVADGANGVSEISVLVNGVEKEKFTVEAMDYHGLGYTAVSTKNEFFAMKGTGKYVLTNDIDLEGEWLNNTESWVACILELTDDAIIDGNGHIVRNARMAGGWSNSWISTLNGTVKNIIFLNIISPDRYPYGTGLIGKACRGKLENVYLQINVVSDGDADTMYTKGGTLVGILDGGSIKNCIVDFKVQQGLLLNNYGSLIAVAGSWGSKVENCFAITHRSGVKLYAGEPEPGVWDYNVQNNSVANFDSVHSFIQTVGPLGLFDSNWVFTEEGLEVYGNKVLISEAALDASILDSFNFAFEEESCYVDFSVYRYGELSTDFTATFTSSDENVFVTTADGAIIFTGKGTATLTIVIEGVITLTSEITISDQEEEQPSDGYVYISTAEEWRTLITANPAGKFRLANDIDLAGGWFTSGAESQLCKEFSGELDGQGHIVKNAWMPSGWAQPSAFGKNTGTIKNIGFINIHGGNLCTDTAIIGDNFGLVDNVFVDWVMETNGQEYGFAGVIVGYTSTGTVQNCITNVRLGEGLSIAPSFYGSIIGNANNWNGKLINCYSIANGTGVKDVYGKEAAEGVGEYLKSEGNSAQYETYSLLKENANLSGFDSTIWSFTETTITFGGNVVYTTE